MSVMNITRPSTVSSARSSEHKYGAPARTARTGLVDVPVHERHDPLGLEVRVALLVAVGHARVLERARHHVVVPREAVVEHAARVRAREVVLQRRRQVVRVAIRLIEEHALERKGGVAHLK